MAGQVHLGHIFHIAGSPLVTGAADALESIPDGALAIDGNGRITYCGPRSEIARQHGSAQTFDHRPGLLFPGFVDTHINIPQTYAGDSYGGGQLLSG